MCFILINLINFSEILMEERKERDESMSRENRRVQAMSWGSSNSIGPAGDPSDAPPPKPSRVPATFIGSGNTLPKKEPSPGPTTYLVAPNSEVLAALMRDNENRSEAGMYNAPASVFNTFTVEFTGTSCPVSPKHRSTTSKVKSRSKLQQPVYANIANDSRAVTPSSPSKTVSSRDVRGAQIGNCMTDVLIDRL